MRPRKRMGTAEPPVPPGSFLGLGAFCLAVEMPRAVTSSSCGLQSESCGVWTSQKAVLRTVTDRPAAEDSRTVSIFMWRPARRPQVTWKAV